jgi:autotransporter-associated beta strand protein
MKYTLLLAIGLSLFGRPAAGGSLGIWTGGGGANTDWSTGANWDGNVVPIFPIGLTFAGLAGLTNYNNLANITVNSLAFDTGAGAFVLNGDPITLGGNISFTGNPATPVTQTINLNMAWTASALDVDTPINGNLTFGGNINSTADYSLNKTDAGTLTLDGTNSIAGMGVNGGTNIIAGKTTINGNGDGNDRLYVGDGDFLNGCNGTLIIQTGAVLMVTGSFGDTFVIGRDSGSGTVIQNGGTFTFNPANISLMLVCATSEAGTTAAYDMNGGLLNMSGNSLGAGYAAAGAMTTGVINQIGGVITNLNNFELGLQQSGGSGVYTLSGGSIYIGPNGITTGTGNYVINLGGGTVGAYASWASPLNMNLTGSNGAVTFDTAANTITLSGTLSGSGGLTKSGSGTLDLAGANSYTGNTTVNAGTLELDVTRSSVGAIRLANGTMLNLTFHGTYVVAAFYTNGVALPNGVYNSGNLPEFIAGSGSLLISTNPVVRILPVGDSITMGYSSPAYVPGGYRTLLAALLNSLNYNVTFTGLLDVNNPPGVTAWHEGHSGAEIAGVDYCMQGVFDSTDDPDIILLLLGTNDYNNGIGAGATNRLDQMITHLATNRPNAKIIVANLLLRTDNATLNSQINSTFNPFIPGIVAAHAALGQQVYFTDLRSVVTSAGLSSDGIHPNASGYASMATNWFNAITNVIGVLGTTNAPVIWHVVSQGGLANVAVTFSKPVAASAANIANFRLNGGVTISAATLDAATGRVVMLTTSPLTQNASYTLTVSNVVDLTAAQTPIAGGTTVTFNACGAHGATNNVTEASHFQLAYSLDVPNAPNYASGVTYTVDNHAGIGAFGRLAYYLELQATNDGPVQFIWVSLNPFTTNLAQIGVPTLPSGAVFQQNVTNMNVISSVAGIVSGTNLGGGNLEFWPYNYSQNNALGVAQANSGTYDWGDQNSGNGNYGSMQIANHQAAQMLMSFNAWGGYGGNADLGIGNNLVYQTGNYNTIDNFTDIQPDWTFRENAASYAVKTLQVFIQPVPVPRSTNLVAVLGASANLATSNLVALAGNPANYSLSITGVSAASTNGSPVSLGAGIITYTPVAIGPDQFTYTLSDGHGGSAIGAVTVSTINGLGGRVRNIALMNGIPSMTFMAIPGYQYQVQVSTNLINWNGVMTTSAPAGGVFQFNDTAAPLPDAFYRLMWNGN